jgi:hypothetical protein
MTNQLFTILWVSHLWLVTLHIRQAVGRELNLMVLIGGAEEQADIQ